METRATARGEDEHHVSENDQMSLFGAAADLPPAYPDRAAWGTAPKLRAWQAEAIQRYEQAQPRDFMAVATPGAGKTLSLIHI